MSYLIPLALCIHRTNIRGMSSTPPPPRSQNADYTWPRWLTIQQPQARLKEMATRYSNSPSTG
ncbi:BgTH12-01846 [Blumeria graminis f. sp. triticale]|uniref:Bgt-4459 n=2 Tax=Blumeria graminis TaxID=34373 RepID=A0A9X9MF68_BLUGR|nr:BgTH12-01846 [Blumeria graminis f. sp. triticale]VDB84147.1 Bgt-4459 [Blumeria graminis f. sp. tritici]